VLDAPRRARLALALLFAINLLNFYDRHILATVTEPIRKQYGFTDTQLGWLGTAFILLYAIVGVPFGRLADRWNRKLLLVVGLFVWSILTALSGAAVGFWSLFLTRLGMGIGEAACAPVASSLIGDFYPASRRARAMSIFMLGLPLGAALSYFISGAVAQAYSWRAPFLVAAVPGLIVAALTLALLVEPPRGAAETVKVGAMCRQGSPYALVLSIPTMWWIIASGALHNFNMYALAQFLPAFLGRWHAVSVRQAGAISGLMLGLAGGLGLFFGGHLADRLSESRPNGRLWIGSLCLFAAVPLHVIALGRPPAHPLEFLLWMLPGTLLMYVYYSTVYATIQDIVEPSLRGTAMAVYFLAMYALGGSVGPLLTGRLSDHMAHRAAGAGPITEVAKAAGLQQAMYIIPALEILVGLVLYAGSRTVARDRRKLQSWMAGTSDVLTPAAPVTDD
jgi:MFS family permease